VLELVAAAERDRAERPRDGQHRRLQHPDREAVAVAIARGRFVEAGRAASDVGREAKPRGRVGAEHVVALDEVVVAPVADECLGRTQPLPLTDRGERRAIGPEEVVVVDERVTGVGNEPKRRRLVETAIEPERAARE
jgi:hypothetical protein